MQIYKDESGNILVPVNGNMWRIMKGDLPLIIRNRHSRPFRSCGNEKTTPSDVAHPSGNEIVCSIHGKEVCRFKIAEISSAKQHIETDDNSETVGKSVQLSAPGSVTLPVDKKAPILETEQNILTVHDTRTAKIQSKKINTRSTAKPSFTRQMHRKPLPAGGLL
jgi:hypothetical protein